jgi:hypothetical protein
VPPAIALGDAIREIAEGADIAHQPRVPVVLHLLDKEIDRLRQLETAGSDHRHAEEPRGPDREEGRDGDSAGFLAPRKGHEEGERHWESELSSLGAREATVAVAPAGLRGRRRGRRICGRICGEIVT